MRTALNLEYPKMSTLKNISLDLKLGQTILVGPGRKPAEITKIEYFAKTGEIVLNTTQGVRRALTFALVEDEYANPADRFR